MADSSIYDGIEINLTEDQLKVLEPVISRFKRLYALGINVTVIAGIDPTDEKARVFIVEGAISGGLNQVLREALEQQRFVKKVVSEHEHIVEMLVKENDNGGK